MQEISILYDHPYEGEAYFYRPTDTLLAVKPVTTSASALMALVCGNRKQPSHTCKRFEMMWRGVVDPDAAELPLPDGVRLLTSVVGPVPNKGVIIPLPAGYGWD